MAAGAGRAVRPRRFYAKIALDPNRPTPQVSNIAQSILSELDRVRGTRVTLTLDIDAETVDGFPEDVESVVRATLRACGLPILVLRVNRATIRYKNVSL